MCEPFDLSSTYVHLGLGATAEPLPDFEFSPEYLSEYGARTAADDPLQEIDGEVHTVELTPGRALFITPGRGTENRPR